MFDQAPPNPPNPDDPFAPLPPSGTIPPDSEKPKRTEQPPYVPPPPSQQQPRKGPNPLLMILLGAVLGIVCLCGACAAVFGGSIAAVFQNPTFQASIGTVQVAFGTMSTGLDVPQTLPTGTQKGTLTAGTAQSAQLDSSGPQIWNYRGRAGEKFSVTVTSKDSDFVPLVGVYDSQGNLVVKSSFANTRSAGGATSQTVSTTFTSGDTYSILVTGLVGTAGNYQIQVGASSQP